MKERKQSYPAMLKPSLRKMAGQVAKMKGESFSELAHSAIEKDVTGFLQECADKQGITLDELLSTEWWKR